MRLRCFILFIGLIISSSLAAQYDDYKFVEFEFSYGKIKTSNSDELGGYSTVAEALDVWEESDLNSTNYHFSIIFNVDPKNAVKFGFGSYKNGRTITTTYYLNNISSEDFTNVPLEYSYINLSANHILEVLRWKGLSLKWENGVNVLIEKEQDVVYYIPTKDLNFNLFSKIGPGIELFDRIEIGGRFTFSTFLNDYHDKKIMGGFKPISYGGEAFLQIRI